MDCRNSTQKKLFAVLKTAIWGALASSAILGGVYLWFTFWASGDQQLGMMYLGIPSSLFYSATGLNVNDFLMDGLILILVVIISALFWQFFVKD